MIASLTGTIAAKDPDVAVVDVSGVGYRVQIPLSTYNRLGDVGATARLFTHLSVRENAMELFGFGAAAELDLFERLIEINGVGPKLALSILSGMEPDAFRLAVMAGDVTSLSKVPGVGKKTAGRLVMEMREAFESGDLPDALGPSGTTEPGDALAEAVKALVSLGLNHPEAAAAVRDAARELGEDATTEELVKDSLKRL